MIRQGEHFSDVAIWYFPWLVLDGEEHHLRDKAPRYIWMIAAKRKLIIYCEEVSTIQVVVDCGTIALKWGTNLLTHFNIDAYI